MEWVGMVAQVWDYPKFQNQSVKLRQLHWEYHQVEDFKSEMGPMGEIGAMFHQAVVISLEVIMRLTLTLEQAQTIKVTPPYAEELLVSIQYWITSPNICLYNSLDMAMLILFTFTIT